MGSYSRNSYSRKSNPDVIALKAYSQSSNPDQREANIVDITLCSMLPKLVRLTHTALTKPVKLLTFTLTTHFQTQICRENSKLITLILVAN